MDEEIENEFSLEHSSNPESNFQNIQLNFENIEEISKKDENDLDNFYLTNEKEISNLLSSVSDVNQTYLTPENMSKIIKNKIKKFFNLEEFLIYFKNEPKIRKFKKEEKPKKNIKKKEEQEKEKEEDIIDEGERNNIEKKKEKVKEDEKNNKKISIKFKLNIDEIISSDSSISESSTNEKILVNKLTFINNIIDGILFPVFCSNNIEELFDVKDYESRVKGYLKLFLECCTEKDIKIESSSGRSIKFFYKLYEKIIEIDESKKNVNIKGNSMISSGGAEIDFIIKNINKDIILSIKENFKGNIICSSNLNSLNENKNYQIIGEIAKNILHQSSDKIKQINKYVDIILINDIIKNIENLENKEKIVMNFNTLNFNFNDDKIIMIVTDGSYVKLSKASNFNKKIENQFLTNREIKDIQNYRKIIQLLNDSKIPFIIFFIPNDLRNNIDDYLIEHAKKKNFKEIKTKSENNINKCYSIKLIEEKLNNFKSNIFIKLSSICSSENKILENISNNLYDEIIEGINPKNIFTLELIILKKGDFNIDDVENNISLKSIIKKEGIKYTNSIIYNDKDLDEYIKYHKKIPDDTFRILFHNLEINEDIKYLYEKVDTFSFVIGGKDIKNILPQVNELQKDFKSKFRNYYSQQIKKKIYKYCLYYSNNKEYLNGKNLKNKIIYDLGKLNLSIKVKKNEKSFSESESYKDLLNIISNIDLRGQVIKIKTKLYIIIIKIINLINY